MFDLPTDLPADIVPLSWLLGVWEGTGVIDYADHAYTGEFTHRVSFSHDGGDYLNYSASAWFNGEGGTRVELTDVLLRDSTLTPGEILMSESQERMMAVVAPDKLDAFMAIAEKWDVEAVVLGEVTDGENLVITWHGDVVVDVPPRSVAHDGPVYERPLARPEYLDAMQDDVSSLLRRPASGHELRAQLLQAVIAQDGP